MPEMNGFEFLQAVRADARYADVPLLMVTTETEMSQIMMALDHGANEYVMKPFTADILRDKLDLLGLVPSAA
jgi:two-component system chemotaxis response regulator CheY